MSSETFLLLLLIGCYAQAHETNEIDNNTGSVITHKKNGDNNLISNDVEAYLNYGYKKVIKPKSGSELTNKLENSVIKSKVELLSGVFKKYIEDIKSKYKKIDVVFLIDASSSVGKKNFKNEIKFVKKLLGDFIVSKNYTRVAVITFSSVAKVIRHIDQVSASDVEHDKCMLLNYQIPKIGFSGGGTFTYGALLEASKIFKAGRSDSKKIIFLVTDGFSNGMDPIPLANALKQRNITIYTIGIQTGNYAELYNISSKPGEYHSYLLDSFSQFQSLARKALHIDFKAGANIPVHNDSLCNILCDLPLGSNETCCDKNAECSCGISSGHYTCSCQKGFFGTGLKGSCQICTNGTYWEGTNSCRNCPDPNHVTHVLPALSIDDCLCKEGFKKTVNDSSRCEVLQCPELSPPKNGYFVKDPGSCVQVLNAACGARCKSGYQLTGSSIRLCQENGTWSGVDAECVLKTCPALIIPYYGLTICKNPDLNLYFDYSPRNATFIANYTSNTERLTEEMPIDTECNFKCGAGFSLVGSAKRSCLPVSKWDGLTTTCKQILCSALPKVPYGEYDPTDCAEQKSAHGTDCTLTCEFGFELKGAASTKTCGGKRNGVWSQKNKTPKCVDVTPPHLICPNDYDIPLGDDQNYAILRSIHQPYVSDNSDNFTFWTTPAVKEKTGAKLFAGNHTFTYVAVDGFKNKAKCNVTISIIDITPPVVENCVDPPTIYVTSNNEKNDTFIEWDGPQFYDNSQENITIYRNLSFGYLAPGEYKVGYNATDASGNSNLCVLNVTVKEIQCDNLPSPLNGQTVCAKNASHTWCHVNCNEGFSLYDDADEEHFETLKLFCENLKPSWKYDVVPDCTELKQPTSVEEVISISMDSDTLDCTDTELHSELKAEFLKNAQKHLCGDQEDCEVTTDNDPPACTDVTVDNPSSDKTFYNIVKRDLTGRNLSLKNKLNFKVTVYTKIAKKLGIWRYNGTKSDNIKKFKTEISQLHSNEKLRKRLEDMKIDFAVVKFEELIKCPSGSIARKLTCGQCPRGTYKSPSANVCEPCPLGTYNEETGRQTCMPCDMYHSTSKIGSKHSKDCKEQCTPGSYARMKLPKKGKYTQKFTPQKSLVPFCRKCQPGDFQPLYDQLSCERCPDNFTSPRGALGVMECIPILKPCLEVPPVCGDHGKCVPAQRSNLYTCSCDEGFIGAHCDVPANICASSPCYNAGTCELIESPYQFECKCRPSFKGEYCEIYTDPCLENPCRNNATCVDLNGHVTCECMDGFEGELCDRIYNHCQTENCDLGECVNHPDGYFCQCPPGRMGKRCHLRPCDYLPCLENSNCEDILEYPATRNSYECNCPKGLNGHNCSQITNPCDRNPCKNNGHCIPTRLRLNTVHKTYTNMYEDENVYEQYTCECPPYFYGANCEIFTTPDFVLSFDKPTVHNYVKMKWVPENLNEIAFCVWIQTSDSFNYGTLLSYASRKTDNMFTFTDYNGFVLYINGQHVVTDIAINDNLWHFICASWTNDNGLYEIYLDGKMHTTGFNISTGQQIEGKGVLILGQEQDTIGGGFSESESYVGQIAYLDMWSRTIDANEVQDYYTSCEPYQGNMVTWSDTKINIKGSVKIQNSLFCKPCEKTLVLQNGVIDYNDYDNYAYYQCDDGYKLEGSHIRNCLRTSQWQLPAPSCKLIRCGSLQNVQNAKVHITKSSYGGLATWTCDEDYYLSGAGHRFCTVDGVWSQQNPECISKMKCDAFPTLANGHILYATEKGVFNQTLKKYPIGTLAEFRCIDGFMLSGENLINCLNSGQWDVAVPSCIRTKPESYEVGYSEETMSRVSRRLPTKHFWQNLRDYYFHSCRPNKVSRFCQNTKFRPRFNDLQDFESPDTEDFQIMDIKLLNLLKRVEDSPQLQTLTVDQFLDFLLYGLDPNAPQLTRIVEDSHRFVLCLYIDILMMDSDLTTAENFLQDRSNESVNDRIKYLLKKVMQPIYENYLRLEEETHRTHSNAILRLIASKAQELNEEKERSKIRYSTTDMAPTSRDVTCELPTLPESKAVVPVDLRFSYRVGEKIEYECESGLPTTARSSIECLANGEWSELSMECTKI